MLVSQALTMLHQASKTRSYDETYERAALSLALNKFMRETRLVWTQDVVSTVAGDEELDVSDLADFRPERLIRAELVDGHQPISLKGYNSVLQRLRVRQQQGKPLWLGWRTHTTGVLYPTPDAVYEVRLTYAEPPTNVLLTSAEDNDDESSSSSASPEVDPEINIPDEYLHEIIWFGATAALEHNDPDVRFQSVAWQRFEEFIQRVKAEVEPLQQGEIVFDPREYL